ncbi:MAG TPA: alpha-amylase family glycosyl hydrolase [Steroidobacteraceae bacterium]
MATNDPNWWQGSVIYQIYPRSFQDTDGDGIGDLPGIIRRLDYVANLGIDAIWISPFFKSPMADFGYDISDYRQVDPLFGTLADFDELLREAHRRNLKVMIDQVLSHTSIEHAWFQASRQNRENPYADWYVWADPSIDGTPPNNWMSIFGGVAWTWEPRRQQYYLHNFLAKQPDLNFHEPAVRQAALENVRFWLERGVDGLRLDAINFCYHDKQLRDNPPKPAEKRAGRGFKSDNPYAYQYHYYNNTRPENIAFLSDLRAVLDQFPGKVALGEISSEDSIATMVEYTQPGRLHMAYSFELLGPKGSAQHFRDTILRQFNAAPSSWPCWAISNHDVERVVSRWGNSQSPPHMAAQLTALLCSLRGSVSVYQGEELGLPEADVPFERLQDPYGITFWPNFKGRDGCRTPMPWSAADHAEFSAGTPWLPIAPDHRALSVSNQEADEGAPLQAFRRLLRWRGGQEVLRGGEINCVKATAEVLSFQRFLGAKRIAAAFNLSNRLATVQLGELRGARALTGHGLPSGSLRDDILTLPPHGVFFGEL